MALGGIVVEGTALIFKATMAVYGHIPTQRILVFCGIDPSASFHLSFFQLFQRTSRLGESRRRDEFPHILGGVPGCRHG